jgi:S-sulfo-L-cysteine synthase (3-phospho-L-serine-dependent)
MSGLDRRRAVVFIESNTSGTGLLFIRAAECMGYRPVLVTAQPAKYRFLSEPGGLDVMVVDRVDEQAVYDSVLLPLRATTEVGGITSSSEYHVATAAALAERMGLPGPDAHAVREARDKSIQRVRLAAAGLPGPHFRVADGVEEAVDAARAIGFPVVVKPTAESGSVGVRACADDDEVRHHAETLLSAAARARVLVESFVQGEEFSVEVFSGKVVGITRKHVGSLPCFVETGHDFPAQLPSALQRRLTDTVTAATRLLGLGWGPIHWELRVHRDSVVPIEVNPRLAGGFIPVLVRHALGVDLIRETLRLVLGDTPNVVPERRRYASIRFLLPPMAGTLRAVEGGCLGREQTCVVDLALYRSPGDALGLHGDFRDRVGHVIAVSDHPSGASAAAERARDCVRLVVEEQQPEMPSPYPERGLASSGTSYE